MEKALEDAAVVGSEQMDELVDDENLAEVAGRASNSLFSVRRPA